jgi:hypothetical protein
MSISRRTDRENRLWADLPEPASLTPALARQIVSAVIGGDPNRADELANLLLKGAPRPGDAAALPLLSGSLVLVAPRQALIRLGRWLHLDLKQLSKMDSQELILCLHDSISHDVREHEASSLPVFSGSFALLVPGRALLAFAVSSERGDKRNRGDE